MRVRKNAPTANIRTYMRGNLIYADVRIAVRQGSGAWPSLIGTGRYLLKAFTLECTGSWHEAW